MDGIERTSVATPVIGHSRARARLKDADTFPKVLIANARDFPDRPASREKSLGIWQTWTWGQVLAETMRLAAGLHALGARRGDTIAIVGDNRPRLYWTMCAAQAIGCTPVPVYQDAVAAEMGFVIDNAGARFAIAEDQEQVDKLLQIKDAHPGLETIVFEDGRGMRHYAQPFLSSFAKVQEMGRELLARDPGFFEREAASAKGGDIAVMLYTSGTTGQPKGVVLSHTNVLATALNSIELEHLTENEETLAYLPMAWVGDHIFSFGQSYVAGFCVGCPESGATVMTDLRELGPTYFFAPPRIWENILTTVMIRMEDASRVKCWLFKRFMDLAKRVGPALLDKKPVGLLDRLLYRLGDLLVFAPLRNTLGFSRIRLAYTAGEAIGPDIFDFYRSLGVNVKQLYGMTEAAVFICIQPDGEVKPDTVGPPAPEVEVRIEPSGEVLFRSPGVFQSYYKNDKATAETKTADGWVKTGDAGFFGSDGHLRIIDRAKDVGKLADGSLFAPKYIENKLKFFPYIREAVAFGADRGFAAAFINIDLAAVGNWAERKGIVYGGYQELAAHPEVYALIQGCVERVNRDLSREATLAGSQIRRFLVLHKDLDADDGELTRTRKVRRSFVQSRYETLVEGLFSDAVRAHIETEVTFEDGRKGRVEADVAIAEAERYPLDPLKQAS
ncbi:MAG: long-chain fatty acid--CoA ligase [Alphaproteobacteria bacterium]|nr:long-chain fatty acid--CoA ligase [Alphaproteobacteria bacterium]